jgi:hypothetical protein
LKVHILLTFKRALWSLMCYMFYKDTMAQLGRINHVFLYKRNYNAICNFACKLSWATGK